MSKYEKKKTFSGDRFVVFADSNLRLAIVARSRTRELKSCSTQFWSHLPVAYHARVQMARAHYYPTLFKKINIKVIRFTSSLYLYFIYLFIARGFYFRDGPWPLVTRINRVEYDKLC